jgi:hypothetical protein
MAGLMQDLAGALLMPDAQNPETVQFITDLMAQIQQRATAPYQGHAAAGQLPPSADNGMPMSGPPSGPVPPGMPGDGMPSGGMPGMGGPPMPPPMPPGMPPGPVPPGMGMPSQRPSVPQNPDELRRILGTGAR